MNSSVSICLPFSPSRAVSRLPFFHGALIYFSPLHNAALAVKCMNKERESLPRSLFRMLCREAMSVSKIMDTSSGDQRRSFFDEARRGFIWSWGIAQIDPMAATRYFSLTKRRRKYVLSVYRGCAGLGRYSMLASWHPVELVMCSDWQPARGLSRAEAGVSEGCRHNTIIPTYPYRNKSRQPGAQREANRLAQRSPPLTTDALCQGLVYFTHIKDHMPQFHSTAGGPALIPGPDWPVMDGVDSYKPSTKWSNTKVKVEAASVVWFTMEGLHGKKMLFMLNTNYAVC